MTDPACFESPTQREARAVEKGAPTIADRLTDQQLNLLVGTAVAAEVAHECGAVDSTKAVELFGKMLSATPTATHCQIVFTRVTDGEAESEAESGGVAVVTSFVGNGPRARETARLYAIARDAIISLVLHARSQQRELESYREAIATLTAISPAPIGDEGGAD